MFPYMPLCMLAKVLTTSFDLYITTRQLRNFAPTVKASARTSAIIPPDKFRESQQYCYVKSNFHRFQSIVQATLDLLAFSLFMLPKLWTFAARWTPASELKQTLLFCTLLSLISAIVDLPFTLISTFVVEARFGFNRTTPLTFVLDLFKDALLSAVLGYPIGTALFYVLHAVRSYDPITVASALWLVMTASSLLMLIIYPNFIAPLFNTFAPLPDGQLKDKLEVMATHLNFPLDKIYVIDGSKRSSHSNAFIFGLFRKYICIYDTLLQQNKDNDDQIVAVLCHEIGHWHHSHLPKNIVKTLTHLFLICMLYAVTAGNEAVSRSFGFLPQQFANEPMPTLPVIITLLLFNQLLSPLDDVLQPAQNYVSRAFEYQSDAFAKHCGYAKDLGNALVVMSVANLSNMVPDPLYSAWNYSHPTLLERLDALDVSPDVSPDVASSTSSQDKKRD